MAKTKVTGKVTKKTISTCTQDVLGLIRQRAYHIWETKGRSNESTLDNWLEAEQQLKKERLIKNIK
jgi:hypothetical protein